MKRSVLNQYNQLHEKLTSYVAMMNFRFMNLCVKAEEASLLPVQVNIEGTARKLEEVSVIARQDEYRFYIVPHFDDDLKKVGEAIAMVHPDFIQDVDKLKVDATDLNGQPIGRDVPYIMLTMPEVDNERYDLLKEASDTFYQECKAQMEAAVAQASSEIAFLLMDDSPEEVDRIKNAVENLHEEQKTHRDQLYDDKIREIEEAHNKWLAEEAERERIRLEEEAAHDNKAATQMKLSADGDY